VGSVLARVPGAPRLRVLAPGSGSSGADTTVRYANARQLVSDLLKDNRFVLIEVQAAAQDAGTFSLAEFGKAAILVCVAGETKSSDVNDCIQRLDRLGAPALGTVLLRPIPPAPAGKSGRAPRERAEPLPVASAHAQFSEPAADRPDLPDGWPARAATGAPEQASGPVSQPRQVNETWPIPSLSMTTRERHDDGPDTARGR
jgi:hypothetical protein